MEAITGALGDVVSIPQSGFWLFRPQAIYNKYNAAQGFNPSIGILVVQTRKSPLAGPPTSQFQSLNRDSGCSDLARKSGYLRLVTVSIPQSGFWLFRLRRKAGRHQIIDSFNPSIGILVVQTRLG